MENAIKSGHLQKYSLYKESRDITLTSSDSLTLYEDSNKRRSKSQKYTTILAPKKIEHKLSISVDKFIKNPSKKNLFSFGERVNLNKYFK